MQTTEKVINAKFIFSPTLKAMIVRDKHANAHLTQDEPVTDKLLLPVVIDPATVEDRTAPQSA